MGNINRIDLSKLKSHKSTFDSLEKSFNNSAYSTFNSSYIKRCSDPYVTKMKSNLTLLYNQIKKGYSNIDSWWTKYNQNAEGLEKKLSNEGNTITEYGIRAYATHLPELNDFKIPTTVSYASGGIASALSGGLFSNLGTVVANADPFAAIYSDYNIQNNIKEMVSDTNTKQDKEEAARMVGQGIAVSLTQALSPSLSSFLTTEQPKSILDHALDFLGDRAEDVGNFINDVGAQVGGAVTGIMDGVGSAVELIGEGILRDINNTLEFLNRAAATITTFGTSAIKGIGRAVEGVADFMYSARSVIATPITWFGDLITGGKYNFTERLHEETQAIVSVDITESVASAIGNTGIGKAAGNWMKENAVFYDQVSALGEGVGEVVGILGISALTMGTVNPAIVAGAVGYGKGVQTAYQNGASYGEGILVGIATGGLDATSYYLGGKVGGSFGKAAFAPIAGTGAKVTLGNAGIRVGIDMLLGIGDSLLRPFTQFYQDGYTDPDGNYHSFEGMDVFEKYQVMFEQTGGLEGLAVNATLGAGFSTLGEAFDLKRFFKKDTANASNIKVVQTDIRAKMDRYNELLNIKNSDDYLSYMENARKGSVQVLRPEYEGIEQEFVKLKDELLNITSEGVSQAFEPNIGVEKADSASSKSEGLDLKKFFAKENPQKSVIKEVRKISHNSKENFGNQFLRTLLSGEEIPSLKKLSGAQLDQFITDEQIPFKQLDSQTVKSITTTLESQGVHNWLGSGYFADALSKLDASDFADMTNKIDVKSAIQNLWSNGTPNNMEMSSVLNVLNRFETTSDLSNYLYPNSVKKWKDAIETIPEFANSANHMGKTQQQVLNRLDYYFKDVCDFKEGNYDYIGDRYVLHDPELNIYDQYVKPEFGSERSGKYYDVRLSSALLSKKHPKFLYSILSETKQTSLKKNPIKSALYLDANSFKDPIRVGDTYKCTYRINGKIKKLVGEIDYNGMIDFRDRYSGWMKDAQLVDYVKINPEIIKISDSFVDRLLEVRYVRDGKECLDYFMPTEYLGQSGNKSFDFTKIKEKLNLFDDSVDQNSIKLYVSGKSKIDFEHLGIDKNNPLFVSEDIAPRRYGGRQERIVEMVREYAKTQDSTRKNFEDLKKITHQVVKKYNLSEEIQKKDFYDLSYKFATGGCPYTAVSNAFLDWCLKNDIQIQDRFGYDIGYYTSDSSLYKISTDFVALDLYLSYQGFSNMKEAIKIDDAGLSPYEQIGSKVGDFFENRGIHYEGTYENFDLNKPMTSEYLYNKILSEFVQARKNGEYLSIGATGFDLRKLNTSQSSLGLDGALKNTVTNGQVMENIGAHRMLITDVTKDGKVIVSSWGEKYEFLLDSITSGKNKNSGKDIRFDLLKYKFSE